MVALAKSAPNFKPRFKAGNPVRVALAFPPGHIRTPMFLRGKTGVVLRDFGAFPNPERLAYGCLLYTSDAADDLLAVDLGGRRVT